MAKKKIHGKCLYCEEYKHLQRSHSINKSIFSSLLRECGNTNAAKLISLDSSVVKNTNDNWTDHLLCSDCESYFNQYFDDYGVHALRGEGKGIKVLETKNSVVYQNIDTTRIILYILSLYWRGAKSKHPSYESLLTSENIHYNLKLVFESRKWDFKFISIKISVLFDGLGVFNNSGIRQLIVSPFSRLHKENQAFTFCFLFEGFFIEIYFGKMRHADRKKGSWLKPNVSYMKCDKIDLHSIKELQKIFAQAFRAKRYMELNNISTK